jgi:hypothetical protein
MELVPLKASETKIEGDSPEPKYRDACIEPTPTDHLQ